MKKTHAPKRHLTPAVEQKALITLGDATKMLAQVKDAPSAKWLMDVAAAAEVYARKAKLGKQAVDYAFAIKLEAERMLGVYLRETERAPGAKGTGANQHGGALPTRKRTSPPTLAEQGISHKLASEAQRLASLPDDTFAKVKAGEMKLGMAFREQKREGLAERIAALPDGKHRVIYADPPWKYGDDRGGFDQRLSIADSAAAAQYPTMPTVDICALDVRAIAADDAVLFLWATFPLLEDALQVARAWGFDYKTAFVWDKGRSNIGNYHDARAELLLVAVRGSCPIEIDTRPPQVQAIARTRHSAKPEEFRTLIDALYPSGPRVELFRRGDAPAGWKVWGNEATTEAA